MFILLDVMLCLNKGSTEIFGYICKSLSLFHNYELCSILEFMKEEEVSFTSIYFEFKENGLQVYERQSNKPRLTNIKVFSELSNSCILW